MQLRQRQCTGSETAATAAVAAAAVDGVVGAAAERGRCPACTSSRHAAGRAGAAGAGATGDEGDRARRSRAATAPRGACRTTTTSDCVGVPSRLTRKQAHSRSASSRSHWRRPLRPLRTTHSFGRKSVKARDAMVVSGRLS